MRQIQVMKAIQGQDHDRIAAVGYGSETGNAQEYAEETGRLLERLHFQVVVSNLDIFEPVTNYFTPLAFVCHMTSEADGDRHIWLGSILLSLLFLPQAKAIYPSMHGCFGKSFFGGNCHPVIWEMSHLRHSDLEIVHTPSIP